MTRLELFTVWRESPEQLKERTVGPGHLLERILQGAHALARGERPLPLFLFGPRGMGKSHLVSLARPRLESLGLEVRFVEEDIPAATSVEELLARTDKMTSELATWESWGLTTVPTRAHRDGPTVLILEGMDRRLGELGRGARGRVARQKLRQVWSERPELWVIGTGVELPTALTDQSEPFYGFFDPEALEPLCEADATELFDRVTPQVVRKRKHYRGRRDALLALAGGSPRVVIALAESVAAPDSPTAARDALLSAVDRFTPHYQLRFRDLSAAGQHVVDLLARAPRRLNPTEVAHFLDSSPSTSATQMRRLADDGVLVRREEPGATWYEIAEPLFRFWMEYRRDTPARARVSIAASMLEALYSARELVDFWWDAPEEDEVLEQAACREGVQREAWLRLMREARRADTTQKIEEVIGRAKRLQALRWLVHVHAGNARLLEHAEPHLPNDDLRTSVRFANELRQGKRPRPTFSRWLKAMKEGSLADRTIVLRALHDTRGVGAPWKLRSSERKKLSKLVGLRAEFLKRGRLVGHPPLLTETELLSTELEPFHSDLGDILVAAVQKMAHGLVERVLLLAEAGDYISPLQATPLVATPCPRRPELLAAWLAVTMKRSPWRWAELLSWSRSLADIDDAVFTSNLMAIPTGPDQTMSTSAGSALLSLGLARPDRLVALSQRGPTSLQEAASRALALASQLAEHERAPLHPELEQLRLELTR